MLNGEDNIKALMACASTVMSAPELMKNGIGRAKSMLLEFSIWMDVHEYESAHSL